MIATCVQMPKKSANGVHRDPPEADTKKTKRRKRGAKTSRKKKTGKSEAEATAHFTGDAVEILPPHAGGRPTDYDPIFCDRVLELGAQGKSYTFMAVDLGTTRKTLYNWRDRHPEFLYALERAREMAIAWWEEAGQQGLFAAKFSAGAFAFQMCNRFPDDYKNMHHTERKTEIGDRLAEVMKAVNGATRGLPSEN